MNAKPMKTDKNDRKTPKIPTIEGTHCSLFSDKDIRLFREGSHTELHRRLGAHRVRFNGQEGVYFAVWAPNANFASVIGDFNDWSSAAHPMQVRWDRSGIWEIFIPALEEGQLYKFHLGNHSGFTIDKADPFGFEMEAPPNTASKISSSSFHWADKRWLNRRKKSDLHQKPMSIYELHFGSWRRVPEEGNRWLTYREMASYLPDYLHDMGFTHVEFLPLMEHPFYGSWGYQVTGYFAPSARFGRPDDFKFLVNELHKRGIGVLLDWVPSHFPGDAHGLHFFDGNHVFEHADPREGYHPDWKSFIFNYGRHEVKSFLISNALYWLEDYHIDGLRVDAVASMLYRDYSRQAGEWIPNVQGGRENLEAIQFLKDLNNAIHNRFPDVLTIAEESTAFPNVTGNTDEGGLGFDYKWMMGWMHDSLDYFKKDPIYRAFHQNQITFSLHYAFSERFVLPLSHDEVVHGKGSLLAKMPGDDWQKFANLRTLLAYMYGHPGAKLLFMGSEFAPWREWDHERSLDWHLLHDPQHRNIQNLLKDLNNLYLTEAALYELDHKPEGFEWVDAQDHQNSVFSWLRKGHRTGDQLLFVVNATPQVHHGYEIGVNDEGEYKEILNTDTYGGSELRNEFPITAQHKALHQRPFSVSLSLPPLAVLILKRVQKKGRRLKLQTEPLK